MFFDLPPDPPKFWLPPKPAIIRPAPDLAITPKRLMLSRTRRRAAGALEIFDPPGSVSYTSAGAAIFEIPNFENWLKFKLWGAGAGGGRASSTGGSPGPGAGEASTIASLLLSAGGGSPGQSRGTGGNGSGGAGGTASGGDINTNGEAGNTDGAGHGGDAPNGGDGGEPVATNQPSGAGNPGQAPGGGGAGGYFNTGSDQRGGGGGSGAYVEKTYARGDLTPGTLLDLVIGDFGNGHAFLYEGGNGARGQIDISWA